jgi:hypothetical protein
MSKKPSTPKTPNGSGIRVKKDSFGPPKDYKNIMNDEENNEFKGTLQEHLEKVFKDDHQRLMRSLFNSLTRESELYRQLRRFHEQLVNSALRLQVAIKVSDDDTITLSQLRKEAHESKKESLVSKNAEETATGIVRDLRIEISCLKRKLKEAQQQGFVSNNTEEIITSGGPTQTESRNFSAIADDEVDKLMVKSLQLNALNPKVGAPTPFQSWKTQQYLWAPDSHDPVQQVIDNKAAVDRLAKSATGISIAEMSSIKNPIKKTGKFTNKNSMSATTLPQMKCNDNNSVSSGSRDAVWTKESALASSGKKSAMV